MGYHFVTGEIHLTAFNNYAESTCAQFSMHGVNHSNNIMIIKYELLKRKFFL